MLLAQPQRARMQSLIKKMCSPSSKPVPHYWTRCTAAGTLPPTNCWNICAPMYCNHLILLSQMTTLSSQMSILDFFFRPGIAHLGIVVCAGSRRSLHHRTNEVGGNLLPNLPLIGYGMELKIFPIQLLKCPLSETVCETRSKIMCACSLLVLGVCIVR